MRFSPWGRPAILAKGVDGFRRLVFVGGFRRLLRRCWRQFFRRLLATGFSTLLATVLRRLLFLQRALAAVCWRQFLRRFSSTIAGGSLLAIRQFVGDSFFGVFLRRLPAAVCWRQFLRRLCAVGLSATVGDRLFDVVGDCLRRGRRRVVRTAVGERVSVVFWSFVDGDAGAASVCCCCCTVCSFVNLFVLLLFAQDQHGESGGGGGSGCGCGA